MINIKFKGGLNALNQVIRYLHEKRIVKKSQVYHELVRTSNAVDADIDFVIEFLVNTDLASYSEDKILVNNNLTADELLIQLKLYFLSRLYADDETKRALFVDPLVSIINDYLYINIDSIKIKFRHVSKQLIDLEIAELINDKLKIIDYSLAKEITSRIQRRMSLSEFKRLQEIKHIKGEIAEKFILQQEIIKLKKTNYQPVRMSIINVTAGYDILSYDDSGNKIYLEVKALTKQNEFYFSSNELNTSKFLGNKYFIVLVEVLQSQTCKVIQLIQNPSVTLFDSSLFKVSTMNDYKFKLMNAENL